VDPSPEKETFSITLFLEEEFPDFDGSLFIKEVLRTSPESRLADKLFDFRVSRFEQLIDDLLGLSRHRVSDPYDLPPSLPPHQQPPPVNFARHKHRKRVTQLDLYAQTYFALAASLSSTLLASYQERRRSGAAIHCFVTELRDYILRNFETREVPTRLRRHAASLRAFVCSAGRAPLWPAVPIEQLRVAMRDSAVDVVHDFWFSPYGFFDDMFVFAVKGLSSVPPFDEAAAAVDFVRILELRKIWVEICRPQNPREKAVVVHAVYRFFFDRVFLRSPSALTSTDAESRKIREMCEKLRVKTPEEVAVPEDMMLPEMMAQPFNLLTQNSLTLLNAVKILESIVFITNPGDILMTIFASLKAGQEFVHQNRVTSAHKETDAIALDEFLPLFTLIFAQASPADAYAIARFCASLRPSKMMASLGVAAAWFESTLEHVENLMGELNHI
jgi:hypothetical protein